MTLLGDLATFAIMIVVLGGVGYIGFEVGHSHGRQLGYRMARVEHDEDRKCDVAAAERAPGESPQ